MNTVTALDLLNAWPLEDSDDIGAPMRLFEQLTIRQTGQEVDLTEVITPLTVLAFAAIRYAAARCETTPAEVIFDLRELLTDDEAPV